jgi:hypothetical protein
MKNRTLWKGLAVEIIFLFVTMIVNPAATQNFERQFLPATKGDDVNWTINGTIGNFGWYISPVTMTCTYDHELIEAVYYEYDGSGWVLYSEPFTIYNQGQIFFSTYWVYFDGTTSNTYYISFKIDYTPPVIQLNAEKIAFMKWLFSANTYDNISGLARVEFYIDDQFLVNVTAAPYEWFWTGVGRHTVKAIAYDCAGNNASSSATMAYSYEYRIPAQNRFLLKFFERFPHAFPIFRYMLEIYQ